MVYAIVKLKLDVIHTFLFSFFHPLPSPLFSPFVSFPFILPPSLSLLSFFTPYATFLFPQSSNIYVPYVWRIRT